MNVKIQYIWTWRQKHLKPQIKTTEVFKKCSCYISDLQNYQLFHLSPGGVVLSEAVTTQNENNLGTITSPGGLKTNIFPSSYD